LLALVGIVVVGIFYWKPLHSYVRTKHDLRQEQHEVSSLETQKQELQRQIAAVGSGATLVREARRLGLVKPGEQLFIVRGIDAWRRAHR
jgi:cell division protein FtsB